ncbi:MAG: YceH family protein [Phycisphaerae bacterium]|nr:YceH family protein [Phycisphaerae bacterium]
MAWTKEEIERRVLGVLIEKSLAQPEYYPMTINAIVTACNQKNNRDPVMDVDEDAAYHALEELRLRGAVTVVLPGPGARTKRYKHEVETYFRWQKRERAVMAELLLRGPQTTGELRSRCARMAPFESVDVVMNVLDCLAGYEPPCVVKLPRGAGQSVDRYRQLLYEERDLPAAAPADAQAAAPRAEPLADVAALQQALQALRKQVEELSQRVERIENELR